jgi:serine/threonine protein phosphatase PrpC
MRERAAGIRVTRGDFGEAQLHPVGLGLAAIFSRPAPPAADVNEDALLLETFDDESGVLVVADGAGGLPSGEKAAEIAVTALRRSIRRATGDLRARVLDGIDKADAEIRRLGIGAGATLAVCEVHARKARTYHVGDAQTLIVGRGGKVKLFTNSHSPVGYAVAAGLVGARDALMHAERHLVSNLLGQAGMHIEIGPVVDLSPHDTILVASDGLFDNLHVDEIVNACRKGQLLAVSRELAESTAARMREAHKGEPSKPDDLTFIAYRRRVAVSAE